MAVRLWTLPRGILTSEVRICFVFSNSECPIRMCMAQGQKIKARRLSCLGISLRCASSPDLCSVPGRAVGKIFVVADCCRETRSYFNTCKTTKTQLSPRDMLRRSGIVILYNQNAHVATLVLRTKHAIVLHIAIAPTQLDNYINRDENEKW